MVVTGDRNVEVNIWELGSWVSTKTWKDSPSDVNAVIFSPNGEMLVTGSGDNKIRVYSVANKFSRIHTLEGHTDNVRSLSFAPDSNHLVSCSSDQSICLWNPTEGKLLETVDNDSSVFVVTHSPNGTLIATCRYAGTTIKIWDARTLKLKFAIDNAHGKWVGVEDLSFTPAPPFLLSTSMDNTIKVTKIALLDSYSWRSPVLLAYLRFSEKVNSSKGSEVRKFEKARSAYATKFAGGLLQCGVVGGRPKGVLGEILSYV